MVLPRQTRHRHGGNQGARTRFSTCRLSKVIFLFGKTRSLEHFVSLSGQHSALTLLSDHLVPQLAETNARRSLLGVIPVGKDAWEQGKGSALLLTVKRTLEEAQHKVEELLER